MEMNLARVPVHITSSSPPPLSYVAGSSETSDLRRGDVHPDRFFHKRNPKIGRVVTDNIY
jgi:hypothetical protein